jgi:hypothetical protein
MNPSLWFVCGLMVTAALSFSVVCYMNRPLGILLEELCGNQERAEFWRDFSNVTLVLVPVIFAMQEQPEPGLAAVFQIASQVKWGLVGLVVSVLMLGWMLGRFIPKGRVPTSGVRT